MPPLDPHNDQGLRKTSCFSLTNLEKYEECNRGQNVMGDMNKLSAKMVPFVVWKERQDLGRECS